MEKEPSEYNNHDLTYVQASPPSLGGFEIKSAAPSNPPTKSSARSLTPTGAPSDSPTKEPSASPSQSIFRFFSAIRKGRRAHGTTPSPGRRATVHNHHRTKHNTRLGAAHLQVTLITTGIIRSNNMLLLNLLEDSILANRKGCSEGVVGPSRNNNGRTWSAVAGC